MNRNLLLHFSALRRTDADGFIQLQGDGKDVFARQSSAPASAGSMKGKSSNTRKSQTGVKHRQSICRFSADLARANPPP
jgi:hypothetical protein